MEGLLSTLVIKKNKEINIAQAGHITVCKLTIDITNATGDRNSIGGLSFPDAATMNS